MNVWDPPGPAYDPSEAALVARLVELGPAGWIGPGTPGYVVDGTVPSVRVVQTSQAGYHNTVLNAQLAAVPLPNGFEVSHTSDKALWLYRPSSDEYWEFWGLRHLPDGTLTCWSGGYVKGYEAWSGVFPRPYGTSASGLEIRRGQPTIAEYDRWLADGTPPSHAIPLLLPDVMAYNVAAPAVRTDGTDTSATAIPYGARFVLPADFDVSTVTKRFARFLATCAQHAGLVVRERTHGVLQFDLEPDPDTGWTPWETRLPVGSVRPALRAFPWSSLRLLMMDLRSA